MSDGGAQPGSDAEDGSAGGATDGGDPGGGADGASGGPSYATPYFPLGDGMVWTYRMSRTDGSEGDRCENSGSTLTRRASVSGSITSLPYEPSCFQESDDYEFDGKDILRVGWNGSRHVAFSFPPELDQEWGTVQFDGVRLVWDAHYDSYPVGAATYTDCWRVSAVGHTSWRVLCKNVGVVVTEGETFHDFRWELTSFSP